MIPVLYEKTETTFTTYGIGALSDVVSCVVTEERNGQYELIFTYPISGKQYNEIQAERIIKAKAKPLGDDQLFRIYRMSKPIHGIVTVYAQHISYDLSGKAIVPFSASKTPQEAMDYVLTDTGFTAHTDKSGSKTFGTAIPKSARALLGGTEGSVLDQWGGEFKWDNFDVYLYTNRGLDKDVVIEYGKNLTDLLADHDLTAVYSELLPYATYQDDSGSHTIVGDPITITSVISRTKTLIKDFTYDFDGPMTKAQVESKAASWLSDNPLGYETPSLTVSFINLPAPANYPAAAATIDLCDTVTIRYTALGVNVKAKVVSCEYDTLLERYTRLTIGKPRASMADTVANLTDQSKIVADYPALWKSAIEVATQMITGNSGGNVVLHEGPDGKPFELLIMDDPDITQATKIWRWTLGGLGYSTNGYAGPYALAITADGKINADFIRAGRLLVADANDDTLFDANIATNTVHIAGFEVQDDRFFNTETSAMSSYPTKNETYTTEVGNTYFRAHYKGWKESPLTHQLFQYEQSARIERTGLTLLNNEYYNPDYPENYESAQLKPSSLIISGGGGNGVSLVANSTEAYEKVTGSAGTTTINPAEIYLVDSSSNSKNITPTGPSITSIYDTKSVSNNTWERLSAFQMPAGKFLFMATARFDANATGRRAMVLSTTDAGSTSVSREFISSSMAVNGGQTVLQITAPITNSSARMLYLNALQNSGGSLSCDWIYDYVRLI